MATTQSLQWSEAISGVFVIGTLTHEYTTATDNGKTTVNGSIKLKIDLRGVYTNGVDCKVTVLSSAVTIGGSSVASYGQKTVSVKSAANASNTITLGSYTKTIDKTHSSQSVNIVLSRTGYICSYGTTSSASNTGASDTDTITVAAKPSYAISYNANGGSSTPSGQTKWYNETLTLRPAITRSKYNFLGWKWNNSGTAYAAGSTWTNNSAGTFYAAWEYQYTKPAFSKLVAFRTSDTPVDGAYPKQDDGTNADVQVTLNAGKYKASASSSAAATGTTVKFYYKLHTDSSYTLFDTQTTSSNGTLTAHISDTLDTDKQYDVKVEAYVTNSSTDSASYSSFISTASFLVDMTTTGIAFGQACASDGFNCSMPTKFNNTTVDMHNSVTNTNTFYTAIRDDTNTSVNFGVGSGGVNHGVWSDTLNKWIVNGSSTDVYVDGAKMTSSTETLTWATGTDGSGLYLMRYGRMRVLQVSNPTKLAVGNNTVHTLAVADRPLASVSTVLIQPVGAIAASGIFLSLRATVNQSGDIDIYNYRSTAINGNTNQSGTLVWIVA